MPDFLVDIAVVFYLLVNFINGTIKGSRSVIINAASFTVSLFIAFIAYEYVAIFLTEKLPINGVYTNILSFFAVLAVVKYVLFLIFYSAFPKNFMKINLVFARLIGGIASLLYAGIVIFLIFSIIFSLSLPFFINDSILLSTTGKFVSDNRPKILESNLDIIFGKVLKTTIKEFDFLTVGVQEKDEKIDLGFKLYDTKFDENMESEMLSLINQERTSLGLNVLVMDEKARQAARKHGKDMFENGYFSHTNLQEKGAFDRMEKEGMEFNVSGENLALTQDLLSAHNGLMESEKHRDNILNFIFRKVGIGVTDGGERGKIFVQNFAD